MFLWLPFYVFWVVSSNYYEDILYCKYEYFKTFLSMRNIVVALSPVQKHRSSVFSKAPSWRKYLNPVQVTYLGTMYLWLLPLFSLWAVPPLLPRLFSALKRKSLDWTGWGNSVYHNICRREGNVCKIYCSGPDSMNPNPRIRIQAFFMNPDLGFLWIRI